MHPNLRPLFLTGVYTSNISKIRDQMFLWKQSSYTVLYRITRNFLHALIESLFIRSLSCLHWVKNSLLHNSYWSRKNKSGFCFHLMYQWCGAYHWISMFFFHWIPFYNAIILSFFVIYLNNDSPLYMFQKC